MNGSGSEDLLSEASELIQGLNTILQKQNVQIQQKQNIINNQRDKIHKLEGTIVELTSTIERLKKESETLNDHARVKLRKNHSFSSGQKEPISNSMVGNSVEATAGLRHADSVYDLEVQKNRELTRLSRVIDDSARHHYSISPELEQRTQEVIHKKYGGREKAEKAARIIQESYRQYRLRQSFHKLRQAKRRRLTLDSLNSSNAEIETALKNHKKEEIVLNINTTPTEEENKLITQLKEENSNTLVEEEDNPPNEPEPSTPKQPISTNTGSSLVIPEDAKSSSNAENSRNSMKVSSTENTNHRLSTISIADSTCSNVTADRNSIRVSFIESDESDNDHQVKHPVGNDEDLSRLHRSSWVQSGEPPSNNELVRKRMYRIGLNLFNKKPEKGLSFLIKHSFVADSPNVIANFLVTRKGISRQVLGEFLGSGTEKTKKILKSLCNEIDLSNLDVDEALRKFQSHIRIQGEAQRVERLIEAFAQRFLEANQELARQLENPDSIFILAFAIIMLNTDLHSPSMRKEKRMSEEDFIKNLSGINNGNDLDQTMLSNIYNRVKKSEFKANDDHINQVLVIEQRIIGRNKPSLALPYRRLVCYCRMYQIADVSRPQRVGVHQREVFLFNDLLLITKLSGRRRNQYLFRQCYQLLNLEVESFANDNYLYAIKIFENQKSHIMFSLPNKQDRQNFLQDITESIQEVKHMESLRIEDSLEGMREERKENQKSPLTATRKLSSSLHNLSLKNTDSFRSLSTSSTIILDESSTKKSRSGSLQLPSSPEKPLSHPTTLSLSSSTNQTDTSEVKIQARIKGSSNSTEPNSPSSFFGFLSGKSRKNSSSNHQITSLGTSVDQIKEIEEPENL